MVLRLLGFVGGIVFTGLGVLTFRSFDHETTGWHSLALAASVFVTGAILLIKAALHQSGHDKRNLEAFEKIPYAGDKRDV